MQPKDLRPKKRVLPGIIMKMDDHLFVEENCYPKNHAIHFRILRRSCEVRSSLLCNSSVSDDWMNGSILIFHLVSRQPFCKATEQAGVPIWPPKANEKCASTAEPHLAQSRVQAFAIQDQDHINLPDDAKPTRRDHFTRLQTLQEEPPLSD